MSVSLKARLFRTRMSTSLGLCIHIMFVAYACSGYQASAYLSSRVYDQTDAEWTITDAGVQRQYQGRVTHFTTLDGLASGKVRHLFIADNGNLWAGTSDGASRFVPGATYFKSFAKYMASADVRHITQDGFGNVWFATDHGAYLFDGNVFQKLGLQEGLPSLNVLSVRREGADRVILETDREPFVYTIDK